MSESKIQVIRHWNLYKTIINSKNACLQSSNKLGISGGHQHVIHPFPQTSKLSPGTHVLLLADKDTKIHLIFQCKHSSIQHSHQETWKLVHPKFPNIRAPNHLQAPGKMIQNVLHCTFQLFNYFSRVEISNKNMGIRWIHHRFHLGFLGGWNCELCSTAFHLPKWVKKSLMFHCR